MGRNIFAGERGKKKNKIKIITGKEKKILNSFFFLATGFHVIVMGIYWGTYKHMNIS